MKPVDEKDKPKLFALIGLSVLVLGFGIYQVTAGMAGAQPPPAPPKEDAKSAADAAPPAPAADPQAALLANLPTVPSPTGGRDPFIPQMATGNMAQAATKPQTDVAKGPGVSLPPPGGGGVSGLRVGEWLAAGARNATSAPSSPSKPIDPISVPPPSPPTLAVAGVVVAGPGSGNRDVAVLRGGADRRYVTLGDPVGNGFVVSAIRMDGIEIMEERHTSRRFTFKTSKQ